MTPICWIWPNLRWHYLVTGDKRARLLELKRVGTARILTAAGFLKALQG